MGAHAGQPFPVGAPARPWVAHDEAAGRPAKRCLVLRSRRSRARLHAFPSRQLASLATPLRGEGAAACGECEAADGEGVTAPVAASSGAEGAEGQRRPRGKRAKGQAG
eukprot:5974066-Prymnesium_polylepis.2